MTKIRIRVVQVIAGLAGVVCVALALHGIHYMGVAHAAAEAEVTPAATGGLGIEATIALWLALGLAALAGVETMLRGVQAVLAAIAPRTSTTLDDDALAAVTRAHDAVAEAIVAIKGQTKPPPEVPGAKLAGLAIFLLCGSLAVSQASCGPKSAAFGKALWDCTSGERAKVVAAVTPLVTSVILAAASADGKLIDTATVKAATSKASLMDEAGILLECAKASAFAALLTPPKPVEGAPAAAGLVLDPTALRAAYEALRPDGATFQTAAGVL